MTFKPLLASIICCLLIFQFTSCQKDFSTTSGPAIDSTVTIKNDSTLLKLFVKLDTLHPAGQDTLYKMTFTYDDLKRLVSYDFYDYDSTTGVLNYLDRTKIKYIGLDTLPDKIFYQEEGSPDNDATRTTFYENGKLSYYKDNFDKSPNDTSIVKIVYAGDSDLIINYYYSTTYSNDTIHHKAIISNGNVINDVRTYSYNYISGLEGVYTYANAFDEKTNPFKRISFIFQFVDIQPYVPQEDGSFTYIMAKSTNNIINSQFNRSVYQFTYNNYYNKSYKYNTNGLPVSATYTEQLEQQGQYYAGKELYFYTK